MKSFLSQAHFFKVDVAERASFLSHFSIKANCFPQMLEFSGWVYYWLQFSIPFNIVIMNRSMTVKIPQQGGKIDEDFSHFSDCTWKTCGNFYDAGKFHSSPTPSWTTPFPSMRFHFHRSLDFFHLNEVDVLLIWIQCRRALTFLNRRKGEFFGSIATRVKKSIKKRRWKKLFHELFRCPSHSWRRNFSSRCRCSATFTFVCCMGRSKHEDDNFVLNFWWKDKKCMSELILRGSCATERDFLSTSTESVDRV